MSEPGPQATDAELAAYYDEHRGTAPWGDRRPLPAGKAAGRLDVTLSVRFSAAEIAAIRARAEAAGMKPTAYIRRCALADQQPPLDRSRLSRLVETLSRDLEDLRQATS
ncbi:MAG: hypothetical protein M3P96_05145 [Actinomycetota bacterium]|nr:hypothetical protein [Actinomycetota bacterium]